ncbi:MAG: serine hydroxymethyltransferase [Planctomycetota bacterium]|nr:serine hydroxymethyltransferase [Planctomycetota bacterium]MEE2712746.1 serine hydroxymethyltransferase [Planctomycetota bacterium]
MSLRESDEEAFALLQRETEYRGQVIDLVPSDNHPSVSVREAERYPLFYSENDGRNYYYPACETVAEVEQLARERALACFPGAEDVNVKPTDGTRANEATYRALLKDGDTILSLGLAEGGHLSHGLKWNYSGQLYRIVHYGLTPTGLLDMDQVRELALEHRPQMIIAGGSSCPFQFDFEAFADIAKECGALLHSDISHFAGLVVSGHHPSPFPHSDSVMTTLQKTLRGAKGAVAFCRHAHAKALNRAVFPGVMAHATGAQLLAKAICFGEVGQPSFKALMERVVRNAQRLAGALADRGYALVSGGTQTHLMIVDVRSKGLTGKDAERRLQAGGILANKQLIPADPEKPTVCSGIRLGTPCSASRGMGEPEMDQIAGLIDRLIGGEDPAGVRAEVAELADSFPLP